MNRNMEALEFLSLVFGLMILVSLVSIVWSVAETALTPEGPPVRSDGIKHWANPNVRLDGE